MLSGRLEGDKKEVIRKDNFLYKKKTNTPSRLANEVTVSDEDVEKFDPTLSAGRVGVLV